MCGIDGGGEGLKPRPAGASRWAGRTWPVRRPPPGWRAAVGPLLAFGTLTILVGADATGRVDGAVDRHVHAVAAAHFWLVRVAREVTFFGSSWWLTALGGTVFAALVWRDRRRAVAFAATTAGGAAANTLLKYAVHRDRPPLGSAFASANGFGYPSGHSAGAAIVYGSILLVAHPLPDRLARRLAVTAALVIVVAVAASRVVLGVHWLTDVAGGLLFGAGWLALAGPWLTSRSPTDRPAPVADHEAGGEIRDG